MDPVEKLAREYVADASPAALERDGEQMQSYAEDLEQVLKTAQHMPFILSKMGETLKALADLPPGDTKTREELVSKLLDKRLIYRHHHERNLQSLKGLIENVDAIMGATRRYVT